MRNIGLGGWVGIKLEEIYKMRGLDLSLVFVALDSRVP